MTIDYTYSDTMLVLFDEDFQVMPDEGTSLKDVLQKIEKAFEKYGFRNASIIAYHGDKEIMYCINDKKN